MSTVCLICGKGFYSEQSMIAHTESVHGRAGVFKGVSAWESGRGQRGEITRTGATSDEYSYCVDDSMYNYYTERWDCSVCSRDFSNDQSLFQHLNSGVHEGPRYYCQECNRPFTTLSNLTQHLNCTGHSKRESRLIDVMMYDAKQKTTQLMLTDGPPRKLDAEATLFFDGAAIPNPGRGGCGYVLIDYRGNDIISSGRSYDWLSNNQAEYQGLINGLTQAVDEGIKRLNVKGDSELVIKQMNGDYRVRNDQLRRLYHEAKSIESQFQRVTYEYIPRKENARADYLANYYAR